MSPFDLDAEVITHRVEISAWEIWQELARQSHRADPRALQQQPRRALDLGRHERPIEPRVVRDEDAALERGEQPIDDYLERRRIADHFRIDPRQPRHELRNRNPGIDERMECDRAVEHHDRDFHDAVAAKRAHAGGFDVDHCPAARFKDRTARARRSDQRPAAVGGASEARVGRQQRCGDAIGRVPVRLGDAQDVAHDRETRGGPGL